MSRLKVIYLPEFLKYASDPGNRFVLGDFYLGCGIDESEHQGNQFIKNPANKWRLNDNLVILTDLTDSHEAPSKFRFHPTSVESVDAEREDQRCSEVYKYSYIRVENTLYLSFNIKYDQTLADHKLNPELPNGYQLFYGMYQDLGTLESRLAFYLIAPLEGTPLAVATDLPFEVGVNTSVSIPLPLDFKAQLGNSANLEKSIVIAESQGDYGSVYSANLPISKKSWEAWFLQEATTDSSENNLYPEINQYGLKIY